MVPRLRDRLLFGVFVVGWLLPVTFTGMARRDVPGMPSFLKDLQLISCLFIHRAQYWSTYYVTIAWDLNGPWQTVPEQGFSTMRLFGYQSRMEWQVAELTHNRRTGALGRQQLAEWVARQYATLHRAQGPPAYVRFVRVRVPVGPALEPLGRWRQPDLAGLPLEEIETISTHSISISREPSPGSAE